MVQNNNIKIIKKFKEKIVSIIKPEKIVFFGSRSLGTNTKNSDFDLLIVSKDFENVSLPERSINLYMAWDKEIPLELLCYTPKEFGISKKNPFSIVSEAIKTGTTI